MCCLSIYCAGVLLSTAWGGHQQHQRSAAQALLLESNLRIQQCSSSRSNPACAQCLSVSPQEEEDRGKRQVLVLGLDGAGKSSMLQGLNAGESAAKRGRCRPTRGFNFMSLNVPACQLDFLESKAAALTLNTLYPPSEARVGFLSRLFQNIRACQRVSSSRHWCRAVATAPARSSLTHRAWRGHFT